MMQRWKISLTIISVLLLTGQFAGYYALSYPLQSSPLETYTIRSPAVRQVIYDVEWNRTFGGIGEDEAWSVIEVDGEDLVMVGGTDSYGTGDYDMWVIRANATGHQEWGYRYGGPRDDYGYSIIQVTGGDFVVVGYTRSYEDFNYYNVWLVRLNTDGTHQWNQTFSAGHDEVGRCVVECSDGGFAIGGWTRSYDGNGADLWLLRTDSGGQHLWNETYGGLSYHDYGFAITQCSDGGFAIAGETYTPSAGYHRDLVLVRTNSIGQELWNTTFGGSEQDYCWDVIEVSTGGFALAGSTRSFEDDAGDMWLVRTDAAGAVQWNQSYDLGGTDLAYSVIELDTGGFAVGGVAGMSNMWLVLTDTAGATIHSVTYGGDGLEGTHDVLESDMGGYILVGYTESFGAGDEDMWIIRVKGSPITSLPPPPIPGFPLAAIALGAITALGLALVSRYRKRCYKRTS